MERALKPEKLQHFTGLWFTLMPTNFRSFHTPLHRGILPLQQKLRISTAKL